MESDTPKIESDVDESKGEVGSFKVPWRRCPLLKFSPDQSNMI